MENKIKKEIDKLSLLILKNSGIHRKYSGEDLSNAIIIFQEIFSSKMFDVTSKMGFHKRAEYFTDAGRELRNYVQKYTDIDLHKVYEKDIKS